MVVEVSVAIALQVALDYVGLSGGDLSVTFSAGVRFARAGMVDKVDAAHPDVAAHRLVRCGQLAHPLNRVTRESHRTNHTGRASPKRKTYRVPLSYLERCRKLDTTLIMNVMVPDHSSSVG